MNKGELNILIVDDDEDDLLLVENLLREGLKGIALELDKANSFAQGLRQVEKTQYDLLLFDYQLGERSGLELIQEVRAKGVHAPVVFFTGHGDQEVAAEAIKLGAADYIPKCKLSESLVRRSVRYAIELHEKERLRLQMEEDLRKMNGKLEGWVKELERRSRESCLLSELGNMLHRCVRLDEAYALIEQRIGEFFPGRSGALCMLDESRKLLEPVALWGDAPNKHEIARDECLVLRQGRSNWFGNSPAEILCPHLSGSSWKSHGCVPITAYSETLGVMVLQGIGAAIGGTEQQQLRASESERQLAETLSEHLALALANLKLREALREQASHDSLTGLFNRRYMEDFLERAVSSTMRHKRSLAVLMLDLDHFKDFNDAHGHEAGDSVLRSLGQFLELHTRGEDTACRYGGEEFVLILPEVPLAVAAKRAEQLRATLKQAQPQVGFPWQSMPSMSIGVSAAPEHGSSAIALLRVADAALYQAKAHGRDRVVIGEALILEKKTPIPTEVENSPNRKAQDGIGIGTGTS